MMGLVDYGSDSGSGSDDSGDEGLPSGVLVPQPVKGISVPVKSQNPAASSLDDAGFFGDDVDEDDAQGSKLSLPAARSLTRDAPVEEDEIDEIAKPKEWEKKLAEKARRKLEKKAAKRAEKEQKREEKRIKKAAKGEEPKKKRGPVRIDAFGALSKTAVDGVTEKEEESAPTPAPAPAAASSLKLFSMLPAPKSQARLAPAAKSASLMLPNSLRGKSDKPAAAAKTAPPTQPMKPLVSGVDSSDDDDEGGDGDFFGLAATDDAASSAAAASAAAAYSHVPGVPMLPSYGLSEAAGPARPDGEDGSYGYEMPEEDAADDQPGSSTQLKTINNEAAQNMIFKYDYAPFGHDRRGFADAEIVDVAVDNAIGPNVQENLLKNLNRHTMARASLPSLPATGPTDKNAKRKHQITYLANLAVARESELQQKWAEGKAAKRMAKQKYGF